MKTAERIFIAMIGAAAMFAMQAFGALPEGSTDPRIGVICPPNITMIKLEGKAYCVVPAIKFPPVEKE